MFLVHILVEDIRFIPEINIHVLAGAVSPKSPDAYSTIPSASVHLLLILLKLSCHGRS
jgi:hypothetical protein